MNRTIRDGLLVGLIAFASVAGFYAAFDVLAARGPLFTVNLLGQAVFRAQRDAVILQYPIPLDPVAIFFYNGLHLPLSLAIGLIVVGLVAQAERRPELGRLVLAAIVAGFIITVLAVDRLAEPIRALLPGWSIVAANALAVVVAGRYLLRTHPGIWRRLFGSPGMA